MTIRVLQVGLGPIGCAVARQLASHRGVRLVGAVDVDPAKMDRSLSAVAEDPHTTIRASGKIRCI